MTQNDLILLLFLKVLGVWGFSCNQHIILEIFKKNLLRLTSDGLVSLPFLEPASGRAGWRGLSKFVLLSTIV